MNDDTQNPGLLANIGKWWSHPFNTQGSAMNWILFVGLVIIAAFMWQLVLLKITEEV